VRQREAGRATGSAMVRAMRPLAFSALDALLTVGLAAAGFLVVALVCAAVLAVLQVVLPATDSGAAEVDRLRQPAGEDAPAGSGEANGEPTNLDREANA
jgi:hypothetical protein